VLGLFSLYLFLDTYDVRADFNRRTITRLRDLARERGRREQLKAWIKAQLYVLFDRFMRVLRYVVFRGAEGSARKQARLEKQAVWMRESLIDLGARDTRGSPAARIR
jgi:tetrahydrodipicolinate N-succinyltransferase